MDTWVPLFSTLAGGFLVLLGQMIVQPFQSWWVSRKEHGESILSVHHEVMENIQLLNARPSEGGLFYETKAWQKYKQFLLASSSEYSKEVCQGYADILAANKILNAGIPDKLGYTSLLHHAAEKFGKAITREPALK